MDETKKKAKKGAIGKIAKQMAPTSDESYHDNQGVHQDTAQYMQTGGTAGTPSDGESIWDKLRDWYGGTFGEATRKADAVMNTDPAQIPHYYPNYTGKPGGTPPDTSWWADGGEVSTPDDDGPDSEPDNDSDDANPAAVPIKTSYQLTDPNDQQTVNDYLSADKQRQAKLDALKQLSTVNPALVDKAMNAVMGATGTSMQNVGEDVLTEAVPMANTAFQKLRGAIKPVAEEGLDAALTQLAPKQTVAATPATVEAARQKMNNLMAQHNGAYWHPAVKQAIDEHNALLTRLQNGQ